MKKAYLKNTFFYTFCAIVIFAIANFANPNNALAKPLQIEISGGQNAGIPIAVLPHHNNFIPSLKSEENIFEIVKNDLNNSGQFRIVKNFFNYSLDEDEKIDTSLWKTRGAEFLVVGNIIKNEDKTFDIIIKILNVYKGDDEPLINLKFSNQKRKFFRALAHHISDKIFEELIGVPGVFGTKISYITLTEKPKLKNNIIYTLTIADSDGYNDRALIKTNYPIMSPKWSPDGKKIAYVSFRNKHASIKVIDLRNGKISHLTNFYGINGAPAWSPNGKTLAIVLSKDGSPNIYTLDLETKNLTRLTKGYYINTEPNWMPNGKDIVFTSNRNGRPHIYKINVKSGKVKRLTFKGRYNACPSVSADGKNLIMMHQNKKGRYNIAVQSLKTGKLTILTRAKQDESPTLAPNGMMALYGSRYGDKYILGAVSLDGNFHIRLPLQHGNVKDPAWSPYLIRNNKKNLDS